MPLLPLGWRTDLDVLARSGSQLESGDGYILVRSPDNPGFHWGNFLMVTSAQLAGQPLRCLAIFHDQLPWARHVAVGLPVAVARPWQEAGWPYEWDRVLASSRPPAGRPLPAGYTVRRLHSDDDWAGCLAAAVAEHVRDGGNADAAYVDFVRGRMRSRALLTRESAGAFFAAFVGDDLVADLGIVLCGAGMARYQSVTTAPDHRRRGLASHLLAVAGQWAARRGAVGWVIVAEPGSAAERLYRGLGMQPAAVSGQVYRPPAV